MPRMRHTWPALAASIFVAAAASAQPPNDGSLNPPRSPRNADYTITARLDPATRTITGTEVITWRNITAKPAADLQFHLYWNAWKNPRSTFMREQALTGFESPVRSPNGSRSRSIEPVVALGAF